MNCPRRSGSAAVRSAPIFKIESIEAAVAQIHPEVAELRPGQRFEGRYACLSKERLTSRNGSSYLALRLRDRSGTIPARVFRDADRIGLRFESGDAVTVRGKVDRFRGELTAELDDVRRIEDSGFDPGEFLPAAYRSIDELEGFLEHLIREVHDPQLRALVERVVISGPDAEGFRRAPCTRSGHHAYLGGLLEHTVAVATVVPELCTLHPRLDSDLLMAAAIVHDAGRAREFTYGAEFGFTDEGRVLGHVQMGAEIVGAAAGALDSELKLALLGCVVSHHGIDQGRRFPSPEALALYRLNALDASIKDALEK